MAKKEHAASTPEVSSLPIKQDESPLVIDLPDGQKLVVGHLSNGSVIEVATWRGTGRPDSRTSRLMLGMSSAAGAAEQAAAEAESEKSAKKKPSFDYKAVIAKVTELLKAKAVSKKSKADRPVSEEVTEAPKFIQTVSPAPAVSQDDDVEEWLNSIIAKSQARASKPVAKSAAKPKSSTKTVKKAAPKKSVRKATSKSATRSSR